MEKYHISYDFSGEQREQSFRTKAERDATVKDLKANRAVKAISFYEWAETDQPWTRPPEEAEEA